MEKDDKKEFVGAIIGDPKDMKMPIRSSEDRERLKRLYDEFSIRELDDTDKNHKK